MHVRAQATSLELREDVTSLTELKSVLAQKANEIPIAVRDGAVKILAGGYFLKAFLKNMGFNWQPSDSTWEKEIDTAQNSEESIKADLNELRSQ